MPNPATPTNPKLSTWRRAVRGGRAKSAGPPGFTGSGITGGPVWSDAFRTRRAPTPFELTEGYKQVQWACSNLNQNAVARTRLGLYAATGSGQTKPKCATAPLSAATKALARPRWFGPESKTAAYFKSMTVGTQDVDEVVDHPLLTMLREMNDDFDYDLWVRYTVACGDMFGGFYHLPEAVHPGSIVRGSPIPDTLWPLMPQYVLPNRDGGGSLVDSYTYFGATYKPHQLIRGRFVSLRDPFGALYGPAQAADAYARLSDQYASAQENLMTQGGRITGFISEKDPKEPAGATEINKYVAEINSTWNRGNSGKVKYLPGALGFNPVAWPPSDLAALEIDGNALLRIANCFGVPVSLLKTEDVNLANAEAGHLQHAALAVDPRCTMIASALTKWTRRYGREHGIEGWDRLFWAFDSPVAEDREREAKIVDMQLKNGTQTINQVNQNHGDPDVPWGDEPWLPQTLVQPSVAAENRRQAAATSAAAGAKVDPTGEEEVADDDTGTGTNKSLEGEERRPFHGQGRGPWGGWRPRD